MVFENVCILVLWAKAASALEGLSIDDYCYIYFYYILNGTAILAITLLNPKIDMFSSKHDTHMHIIKWGSMIFQDSSWRVSTTWGLKQKISNLLTSQIYLGKQWYVWFLNSFKTSTHLHIL